MRSLVDSHMKPCIHNPEGFTEFLKHSWGNPLVFFSILLASSAQISPSFPLQLTLAESFLIEAPRVSGSEPQYLSVSLSQSWPCLYLSSQDAARTLRG